MGGDNSIMSTSIDNRVVQMEFDNAAFEKGVQQSLTSLKDLHNTIEDLPKGQGFSGLMDSFTTGLLGRVAQVKSNMGEIVSTITSGLGAIGKVAGGISAMAGGGIIGMALSGGKNRALNIEQAKFQLQGLEIAWKQVSDAIDYSVSGTRYGLDSAAKAASQLVASLGTDSIKRNAEGLSDMHVALRAISGTAAMTNSEFDDIADIFTRVAGQGRVMANDLNSLAARGLNAAATLKKALGVSEAEVRDMVSKGEIDFMTFASAMDSAFGEHAKNANATFTGAMANARAALNRIGAEFFVTTDIAIKQGDKVKTITVGGLEAMRRVFAALIPVLNGIKMTMAPVVRAFQIWSYNAAGSAELVLERIRRLFYYMGKGQTKRLTDFAKGLGVIFKNLKSALTSFFKPLQNVFAALHQMSPFTGEIYKDMDKIYAAVKPIRLRIQEITKQLGLGKGAVKFFTVALQELLKILAPIAQAMGGIAITALNVLIDAYFAAKAALDKFLGSAADVISGAGDAFWNFAEAVSGGLGEVARVIDKHRNRIGNFFLSIRNLIVGLVDKYDIAGRLSEIPGRISSMVNQVISYAQPLFDFVNQIKNSISELLGSFAGGAFDAISGIFGIDLSGLSFTSEIDGASEALGNLGDELKQSPIARFMSRLSQGFSTFTKILDKRPLSFEDWEQLFSGLKEAVDDLFSELKPLEHIKDALGSFFDAMSGFGTVDFQGLGSLAGDNAGVASLLDSISKSASDLFGAIKRGLPTTDQFRNALDKVAGKLSALVEAIKPVAKALGEAFVQAIQNGVNFVKGFIDKLGEMGFSLDPLFALFSNIAGALTDFFAGFEGGLPTFDGVKDFFSGLFEALGQFASDVGPKLGEIGKMITDVIDSFGGLDTLKGMIGGFVDALSGMNPVLSETADSMSTVSKSVEKPLGMFSKSMDRFSDSVNKTGDAIVRAEDVFGTGDAGLGSKLKEFAEGVNTGAENILPVAITAAVGWRLFTFSKTFETFLDSTGKFFKKAGGFMDGLQDLATKIGESVQGKSSVVENIRVMAMSLAALVAAVWLLTTVDTDKLIPAVGVVGGLALALGVLTGVLMMLSNKMTMLDVGQFQAIGIAMLAMSGGVLALAVAVRILAGYKLDDLATGIAVVVGALILLTGVSVLLSKFAPAAIKAGSGLLMFSLAIFAVAAAIMFLNGVPWKELENGFQAFSRFLAGFLLVSKIAGTGGKYMVSLAAGLLISALAMLAFYNVIVFFNGIEWDKLTTGIAALVQMLLVFAGVALVLSLASKGMVAGAFGIIALAGAAMVLVVATAMLAKAAENLSNIGDAMAALETFIVIFGLTLAVLMVAASAGAGAVLVVGAILAMSVAIGVLTAALLLLSAVPSEKLVAVTYSLMGLMVVLFALGALTGLVPEIAMGLIVLAGAALGISVAVVVAGIGLGIFATSLALLGAIAPGVANGISDAMQTLGDAVRANGAEAGMALGAIALASLAFGAALMMAGSGTLYFAAGLSLLIVAVAAAAAIISNFVNGFDGSQFAEMGGKMVDGLVAGFSGALQSVMGFFADAGKQVANFFGFGVDSGTENARAAGERLALSATEPATGIGPAYDAAGKDASAALGGAFEGMSGMVSGQLNEMIGSMDAGMGDMQSIFGDGAVDLTSMWGEGFNPSEFNLDQLQTMGIDLDQYMGDFGGSMGDYASFASGEFSSNFNVSEDAAAQVEQTATAIESVDLKGVASKKASEIPEGFKSATKGADAPGREAANKLVGGVRSVDVSGPGRGAGSGIVLGMISGLNALAPAVYARAAEIARTAANKAKEGAQVNSPSKITIPVGEAIGEGLIVGMQRISSQVNASGKKLGESASIAVRAAGSIMESVDWDSEPVIRPVLDTSNIQAGMRDIDRMLVQQTSLDAAGYAGRSYLAQGSMMSETNSANTYNFNLDYRAGDDPNNLLLFIANAMKHGNKMRA